MKTALTTMLIACAGMLMLYRSPPSDAPVSLAPSKLMIGTPVRGVVYDSTRNV